MNIKDTAILIVIILLVFILFTFLVRLDTYQQYEAPCDYFTQFRIRSIPARCLQYFIRDNNY